MISIRLCPMLVGSAGSVPEECTRTVPADMTVMNLRRLCHRIFGVGQVRTTLSARNTNSTFATPLIDDMCGLADYGVLDGCQIFLRDDSSV